MRRFALLVVGLALLAGVAATVSGGATQAEARWVIRDLGTLGGADSFPRAINARGQIVGGASMPLNDGKYVSSHAFLWQNGKMRDLGTLGGRSSEAFALNDRGQVVGEADTTKMTTDEFREPTNAGHAFLWQNGKMRDLGTVGGSESRAVDINMRGQVVGFADTKLKDARGDPIRHAFIWQAGKMRDLGTLGGPGSKAVAINERGQVIGIADTRRVDQGGHAIQDAFLWQNGKMRDLGHFGALGSEAAAINERGQVVGFSDVKTTPDPYSDERPHAFLWQAGKMRDLGTLRGLSRSLRSEATAISANGQVVGWSDTDPTGKHSSAFQWQNGKMRNIGTLGGWSHANAINSKSLIVGQYGPPEGWGSAACIWENGTMTRLEGDSGEAFAVSDAGQVMGIAETPDIRTHAVLWTKG